MRLSGSYFELTDRFARFAPRSGGNAGGPETTTPLVDGNEVDRKDAGGGRIADQKIVISVAKRLVPSAVRRNTVKRIVREAWRAAAGIDVPGKPNGPCDLGSPSGTRIGSAGRDTNDGTTGFADDSAAIRTDGGQEVNPGDANAPPVPVRVCLVRLKRYPGTAVKADARAMSKAAKAAKRAKPASAAATVTRPPGFATIKRRLRADADQLFAAFLQGGAAGPTRHMR